MTLPHTLLLPGLHGNAALWPRFQAAWQRLAPAAAPPPGIVTYPDDPAWDLDAYIRHVEAAISAPVDVVAESFSGPIAMRVAQRGRVQVRRLVLVASFAGALRPRCLPWARLVPDAVLVRPPRWAVAQLLANGVSDAALVDDIVATVRAIPAAVVQRRLGIIAGLAADVAVAQPVLYLQATRDRLVPASALATIRCCCPDLAVTTIAAPHLVLQAAAAEAAAAVQAFCAR